MNDTSALPDLSILIRQCEDLEELSACVRLQSQVWGFEDKDVVPRRALVVARDIGGQVIGAFDTARPGISREGEPDSLVGFAVALPGIAPAYPPSAQLRPYLHSHMLGVLPPYRNRGIGRRLKLAQREDALARGITRMEWTFDPLEIKNSFLNIVKLGAVVRRYTPNLYGVSSSRLQGILPSDRLHAEWWLESRRVHAALVGEPTSLPAVDRRILIPHTIDRWRQTSGERELALRVQQENRIQFEQAFADGLAVFGFGIDAEGNGIFELGRWTGLPGSHHLDTTTGMRRYA
jgi:predicted GNAT superfamily acetyltransferase